ncbi:MAG: hypothetical protein II730_06685 [Bacteroidales bacterium]|nr:hypothetical protein [Bacteroidales bacterium]
MDKTYTIIPDFMLDYDLNMTEIVALAVIYGFCQDGKSDFHGSYGYLARKCKCSRQWAIELVSSLVKKGYLAKDIETINGVKICHLRTKIGSQESLLPVNKVDRGSQESLPGGSQESLPNNKVIDNKEIIKRGSAFAPPTRDQVREFFRERKFNSDPDAFWLHFENCNWKLSSGRGAKMKDWKLAAISWEKRENQFKYGR